jgi:membrane protein EpsK
VGGWLMVLYLGTLFSMRTDIWICNRFVGAEAAGEYAAVLQWSALIRQAGMVLAGVIGPMAIIYYARSEVEQLLRLTHVSIRFLSLLLAVPIAILCVFSSSILRFWLGESFVPLAPLMIIMLCHLTINVGVTPLFSTRLALNVIKIPGLVSCVTGVIGILVAIFFAYYLNWGIYGVAIATAVKLTLVNALWNPVYLASVLRQPWHTYLQPLFSGVVLLALMIMVGLGVKHLIPPTSWVKLLTGSLIMGLLGLMGIWLMLTARDRQLLVDLLPQRSRGAVGGHRQAWPRTVKAEHERVP